MAEREITERKYSENNEVKYVVVTYEVREKDDEEVLIKKKEREWNPETDS